MADFSLHEVDDIKYPKRRPWLLIVLIVIVLVVLWRKFGTEQKPPEQEPDGTSNTVIAQNETALEKPPPIISGPANASVQELMRKAGEAAARSAEEPSALAEARDLYVQALRETNPGTKDLIERKLGEIHVDLALTPMPWPGHKVPYVVKPRDSLEKIARRYGTTIALVRRGNQVKNENLIRAGDSFSILDGDFLIKVSKSRRDLVVYLDDIFFKRYRVGTGKFGKTPPGTFEIWDRITEPVWWRPDGREIPYGDDENILGTRWMAIRASGDTDKVKGYGIHGTWDDASIGKAESAGCIRMTNEDVEQLFDLVPLGTEVIIED